MSIGTVFWGILFTVLPIAVTLLVYYVASGDWLWNREGKEDRRNWTPPR